MSVIGLSLFVAAATFVSDIPKMENVEVKWRNCGAGGGGWLVSELESRHVKDRLFVGCDVGGFYFSENGGRSYEIRNDGLGSAYYVQCIKEHPKDPNVLILGTNCGLYKSNDLGKHWRLLDKGFPEGDIYGHSAPIAAIDWSESDPNIILAVLGARGDPSSCNLCRTKFGAVYRSTDCGESWKMIVADGEEILRMRSMMAGFSVDPRNPNSMLATTTNGVYRSEDGGVHWTRSSEGFPNFPARKLARSVSNPDIVYAGFREPPSKWDGRPKRAGFCRSDDNGRTWRELSPLPEKYSRDAGKYHWRYTEDGGIAINPANPDLLWASGGSFLATGLFKSADGGKTWHEIFNCQYKPHVEKGDWCPWGRGVGSMSLSMRDPKCFVFGTSGTIFRTEDGGKTWSQRYSEARDDGKENTSGLSVICARHVTVDPFVKDRVFFGFMDVSVFRSDDNGRSVVRCMNGIPQKYTNCNFSLVPDPDEKDVFYGTFGNWSPSRSIFLKTVDAGEHWQRVGKEDNGWKEPGDSDCLQLVKTADGKKVFVSLARNHGLQFSFDMGETWKFHGEGDLPHAKSVFALASDGTSVYIGTHGEGKDNAAIFRTDDFGATWKRVTPENLKIGKVGSLWVRGQRILAGTSHGCGPQGIWYSRDGGAKWERVVKCFRGVGTMIGPDGTLYAISQLPGWRDSCGDHGAVIFSKDDGKTWKTLFGSGFVNQGLGSFISLDPHNPKRLWVGTGGNGIMTCELP